MTTTLQSLPALRNTQKVREKYQVLLPPDLIKALRLRCVEDDRRPSDMIEAAIRAYLAEK